MGLIGIPEVRLFLLARRAPGGPEVDPHGVALEVRDRQGMSVEIGEPGLLAVVAGPDEVRRALADLEGSAGFRG